MSRKTNLTILLLMLLLFSLHLPTTAVQPQASDLIPSSGVLIRNSTKQRVKFFLRNKTSEWVSFELNAGDNRPYRNVDQIWIGTDGQKPVHYSLEEKQRYKIIWNGTRWDLNRIAIRH